MYYIAIRILLVFTFYRGVQAHIARLHVDSRPYMCDVCGAAYTEEGALKAHIARHGEERRYVCKHCDYSSHDKGNYKSKCQR